MDNFMHKDTFITLKMLFKGNGPYEMCPRPVSIGDQHKEL